MLIRILQAWQHAGSFPTDVALPHTPGNCRIVGFFYLILAVLLVSPVHHVLEKWDAGSMASIHGEGHGTHQLPVPLDSVEDTESSCMQQDCVIIASLLLPDFTAIHPFFSACSLHACHYSMPDLKPPVRI